MLSVRIACRVSICEASPEAEQALLKDSGHDDDGDTCNRSETRPKHSGRQVRNAGRTQQTNQAIHLFT